ncbi:hypothetical protein DAI22_02g043301 [Oryza sativa Japonica Group]|nr:hypothetical protein DAI22_02g043301 [Oryza sativa Japonica Group]
MHRRRGHGVYNNNEQLIPSLHPAAAAVEAWRCDYLLENGRGAVNGRLTERWPSGLVSTVRIKSRVRAII